VQAMTMIMVSDQGQVEIKRSQVDAKCRGWRRGENNDGERRNSKNSGDASHDLAPYNNSPG
jgi:hypothetical protein